MKRIICLILTLCMILAAVGCAKQKPAADANAETHIEDFEYIVNTDDISIKSYTGNSTEVIIPSKIDEKPVTCLDKFAFSGTNVTKVIIPDSVVYIDVGCFENCKNLTDILFSKNITLIESRAFMSCESLKSVTIPSSVTHLGDNAFSGCDSLEEIWIPKSIESWAEMVFANNKSLKSVTLENGIRSIGEDAFHNCTALETLTIPVSVAEIEFGAFAYCEKLSSIYFEGDAPKIRGISTFDFNNFVTVYYKSDTKGWEDLPIRDYFKNFKTY